MTIEFNRRHAFYLAAEGSLHIFYPYRLDRLWRGEPDAIEPQLASQRIRFAIFHIERFTSPPRVVIEHYPIIPFDSFGRIYLDAVQQQLQADVDLLESTDYAPTTTATSTTTWRPDPFTRRYLIAATCAPSWRTIPALRPRDHRSAAWRRSTVIRNHRLHHLQHSWLTHHPRCYRRFMSRPPARPFHRGWLLGGGAVLGLAAAFLAPSTSGCIYHDTCIELNSPGHDWCSNLALAKQWPVGGSFEEDGEDIVRPDGFPPRGCRCYNDAKDDTLESAIPECRYEGFVDELEQAARQACEALVMPGYDHNCWIVSGSQASIVNDPSFVGPGSCIGNCEYGAPPAGGSCPAPNPYECATGDGGDEGCDPGGDGSTNTGDSGLDDTSDTSGDTSGGVLFDIDAFVACEGRSCEIDETFARRLYHDPSPLLDQGARLVYHTKARRHVLTNVEPGSLAHALGLRTGDRLESVDGMIVHDLDSALQAYARLENANTFVVSIQRGSQWLDFTYTFAP